MIQSGTDLADFLPRRVAWGIVIAVLLAIAIFALPNLKFGSGNRELNLADRNTYMQMMGKTKAEIQQKFGPPKKVDAEKNELFYDIPESGINSLKLSSWVRITFSKDDICTSFAVED